MMALTILISLILIFVGSALLHLFSNYPSYVLINVGDLTIEFSLWMGIASLLAILIFLYLAAKVFLTLYRSLQGVLPWLRESKGKKAEQRTYSGLIHFVEGNWQAAKRDLLAAAKDVDKPLIHYLAAAKSALELGHTDETQFLLHQAEKIAPQNELAIALSQARISLADKKYEQCLAALNRIKDHAKNHPVILDLRRQVYINLRDWTALVTLLPEIKKSGYITEQDYQKLEENVYLSLLDTKATEKDISVEKLSTCWQGFPKNIKKNVMLIGRYATSLHCLGQEKEAEELIRRTLKTQWHEGLVELYGKLQVSDAKAHLSSAESWLKEHADSAYLYLALGRICMRNSLWGKARDYFEKSLKMKERSEIYAELGGLMAQMGEHKKSSLMYQKGLLLKTAS